MAVNEDSEVFAPQDTQHGESGHRNEDSDPYVNHGTYHYSSTTPGFNSCYDFADLGLVVIWSLNKDASYTDITPLERFKASVICSYLAHASVNCGARQTEFPTMFDYGL